jgi:hypothetical protein
VAIALTVWVIYAQFFEEKGASAEIFYHGKRVTSIDLKEGKDRTFYIPENKNVKIHQHEDGSIAFAQSNCPDKVCIETGKIHAVGTSAACLPNGIIIKIVREGRQQEEDPDAVNGM